MADKVVKILAEVNKAADQAVVTVLVDKVGAVDPRSATLPAQTASSMTPTSLRTAIEAVFPTVDWNA